MISQNPPQAAEGQQRPGGPAYKQKLLVSPVARNINRLLGAALPVAALILAALGEVNWLFAVLASAAGVFTWFQAANSVSVVVTVRNGRMQARLGRRSVTVPTEAIAYIGRAEFDMRSARRLGRTTLIGRPGPGVEVVSHDGKYVTMRTDTPGELVQALLAEGMPPLATQVPFPEGTVGRAHVVSREERSAQ
ncbi:hypothetical protein [Nocardiopsis sp. CNT312]|uniref:hypothetical protein n=1 Tax=Nocardiopsis sp. CNT312 TaxID=1137268 RepID=UPI0004B31F48|nr:hypothetical protein [Nocardiopsis sp. CNT312]